MLSDTNQTILGLAPADFFYRAVFLATVFVIAFIIEHLVIRVSRRALDASRIPSASIFLNVIRSIIWMFAILSVLQPVFGIQPTAFVTALGVTSIALSFGLQDTVSNLIGGLGLMLAGVIKPGDHVTIGDISGEVTDINWRSTIVRERTGRVQIIPNSVLNKTAFTHRTRWAITDVAVPVLVKPTADLDVVTKEIIEVAQELLTESLDLTFPIEVRFESITNVGVQALVHLHIRDSVQAEPVADKLVRALAGRFWLAGVES
ncbi:mechanosensitive ion channel domain-containing protein [Lancefieldella rimae]|uniref:mechanosensitive ion channel family protein n=1 Tax=Lancefieldella rimae TaxID=1383 RepID=UPI0028E6D0F4|nr:mechanosensitive ion channel domain-containing protein [Lancefieldella rimae]